MKREITVDSFAGGGGASLGIAWATGKPPDVAINHDEDAIAMHAANHPGTVHFTEDVWKLKPRQVTKGRKVGLLWASPDCRHYSRAKGGKPVEKKIRSLAWVLVKWAAEVKPRVIILENVREFEDWGPLLPQWCCAACGWKGTEGQAKLHRKRRRCPKCDSLKIKESLDQIPDPSRKGLTFKRWAGRLRNLGYEVQWKTLNAADFGAPTHRRRLFLVARCDGQPIVWPEPTHADPKKLDDFALFGRPEPWRTAATIIDWSIPCPSIFDRKRPLAEKTLRRIALGLKRYVLENPNPFLVGVGGANYAGKPAPLDKPASSVMPQDRRAVVTPYVARISQGGGNGKYTNSVEEPLTTVVSKNEHLMASPVFVPLTHEGERRTHGPEEPLPTVTGANRGEFGLASPCLVPMNHQNKAVGVNEPIPTVTSQTNRAPLVAAMLTKFHGQKGSESRCRPMGAPLNTVDTSNRHGIVSAAIVGVGGRAGQSPATAANVPLGTATAKADKAVVAASLTRFNRHGESQDLGSPMGVAMSQGNHYGLVYAFLVKYFSHMGTICQQLQEPLHTATSKPRFGLVEVEVAPGQVEKAVGLYVPGVGLCFIADIGLRMLTPRELARAQGFPDSYILTGSKSNQVAKIGNSVCPPVAKAMVLANMGVLV